jgi:hypothetical protein
MSVLRIEENINWKYTAPAKIWNKEFFSPLSFSTKVGTDF